MQIKDYKNYDYLDIIVKKDNACEIINAYSAFLWEKIEEKDDRHYNDVVHLTFKRDINIENKDRLAYLQVNYETALNKRAEINYKKHSKTKIAICNVAFCSLATLFGIGVFIYFLKSLLSIVIASIFVISLFVLNFFSIKRIRKKFLKENIDCENKTKIINTEIEEILQIVNKLFDKNQENLDISERYENE